MLLAITYRPEFELPWTGRSHVAAPTLSRLGRRQGTEMVAMVTGGKALPKEVLDQIVAKTDGVPLFVEKLTKTVLEAGFLKDAGDHYELDGLLPPLAIRDRPCPLRPATTAERRVASSPAPRDPRTLYGCGLSRSYLRTGVGPAQRKIRATDRGS